MTCTNDIDVMLYDRICTMFGCKYAKMLKTFQDIEGAFTFVHTRVCMFGEKIQDNPNYYAFLEEMACISCTRLLFCKLRFKFVASNFAKVVIVCEL